LAYANPDFLHVIPMLSPNAQRIKGATAAADIDERCVQGLLDVGSALRRAV